MDDPFASMNPAEILPTLAGERGKDAQAQGLEVYLRQHIDVVMGRIRFTGGAGVIVEQTTGGPIISQP